MRLIKPRKPSFTKSSKLRAWVTNLHQFKSIKFHLNEVRSSTCSKNASRILSRLRYDAQSSLLKPRQSNRSCKPVALSSSLKRFLKLALSSKQGHQGMVSLEHLNPKNLEIKWSSKLTEASSPSPQLINYLASRLGTDFSCISSLGHQFKQIKHKIALCTSKQYLIWQPQASRKSC